MFYEQLLLAKKGSLGAIWLAAHYDKKLTKEQIKNVNIVKTAEYIADPTSHPGGIQMSLRLSGHLLLGVVKIYSRKILYLNNDCTEALVKIRMAFHPGAAVDLDESVANLNAITLPDTIGDFEINLPEMPMADLESSGDWLDLNQAQRQLLPVGPVARARRRGARAQTRELPDLMDFDIDDVARAAIDEASIDSGVGAGPAPRRSSRLIREEPEFPGFDDAGMELVPHEGFDEEDIGAPVQEDIRAPVEYGEGFGIPVPDIIPEDTGAVGGELDLLPTDSSFRSDIGLSQDAGGVAGSRAAKRKTRAYNDPSTRIPEAELQRNLRDVAFSTRDIEPGPAKKRAKRAEISPDILRLVNEFPFFTPPEDVAHDQARDAKRRREEISEGPEDLQHVGGPIQRDQPEFDHDIALLEPEDGFEAALPEAERPLEPLSHEEPSSGAVAERREVRDLAIAQSLTEKTEKFRRYLSENIKGDSTTFRELVRGKKRNVAAVSFYELLVLKSTQPPAIDLIQTENYGEITITKTAAFDTPIVHAQ